MSCVFFAPEKGLCKVLAAPACGMGFVVLFILQRGNCMKQRILLVLALALVLGLAASASAADKIVVKIASYYGPTHPG